MLARIRKSMEEKDRGFTLIELLVVMIIIGILAAIAIPVFLNQRKKAADTAIKSDLRNAASAIETAYVDSQTYPAASSYTDVSGLSNVTYKTSTNDTIQYKLISSTAYCIRGYNPNSDATGGGSSGTYYYYDSANGGLQPAVAASSTGCAASA